MCGLKQRLIQVQAAIRKAEHASGRTEGSVRLLAVSKQQPVAAIAELVAAGHHCFGENYLQDALPKIQALAATEVEWHFIGPIQSNKTRSIAEQFAWVHSIDRLRIAQRLSEQRPADQAPLNICLQVNISDEASKSGVSPDAVAELAHAVAEFPRLRLRGLMTIPVASRDTAEQRRSFAQLRQLQAQLNHQGLNLDTLSMGMSADLEAAIAEGATIVRIGTAIFGPRAPRT
jgi:pyridoxal phosphate enzyme (YggS family)